MGLSVHAFQPVGDLHGVVQPRLGVVNQRHGLRDLYAHGLHFGADRTVFPGVGKNVAAEDDRLAVQTHGGKRRPGLWVAEEQDLIVVRRIVRVALHVADGKAAAVFALVFHGKADVIALRV